MIKGKLFKQLLKYLQSLNIEDIKDDYKYDLSIKDDSVQIDIFNDAGYFVSHLVYEEGGKD